MFKRLGLRVLDVLEALGIGDKAQFGEIGLAMVGQQPDNGCRDADQ